MPAPKSRLAREHAADHTGFRRQRKPIKYAFFGGHRRHSLRHADPEIDHAVHRQLKRAAPGDQLAFVEFERRQRIDIYADLA